MILLASHLLGTLVSMMNFVILTFVHKPAVVCMAYIGRWSFIGLSNHSFIFLQIIAIS